MNISNNILRHYLKNCYFINGTAFAGKSTMCALLAQRYGMIHCEENYNMDMILSVVTAREQPNLDYFNTKPSWQHYVSRTPEEFERWYQGTSREVTGFEIAELIRRSAHQKVIVDTNIPFDVLHEISDAHHVAILLSPPSMATERFFDRSDPEKQFLLSVIHQCPNPEETLANFRACIARVNSRAAYESFANSGFFTLVRNDDGTDTREQMLEALAKHFGLTPNDAHAGAGR